MVTRQEILRPGRKDRFILEHINDDNSVSGHSLWAAGSDMFTLMEIHGRLRLMEKDGLVVNDGNEPAPKFILTPKGEFTLKKLKIADNVVDAHDDIKLEHVLRDAADEVKGIRQGKIFEIPRE